MGVRVLGILTIYAVVVANGQFSCTLMFQHVFRISLGSLGFVSKHGKETHM